MEMSHSKRLKANGRSLPTGGAYGVTSAGVLPSYPIAKKREKSENMVT
jgi:hypothetical protein